MNLTFVVIGNVSEGVGNEERVENNDVQKENVDINEEHIGNTDVVDGMYVLC